MRRIHAVFAVFLLCLPTGALAVEEAQAEAIFKDYQRAIVAAEACYGLEFDQAQHDAMMRVINAAVDNALGAKRLRLVAEAKREVRRMLPSQSCDGARIAELLALFEADLQPALTR
jgi:hypothetical protein